MDPAHWLLGAPQFWLGVVACASVILPVSAFALRPPRRTIEVYRLHDRAPIPAHDPFYRPRVTEHLYGLPVEADVPIRTARLSVSGKDRAGEDHAAEARVSEDRIREARKRAMWHPHPDDELPAWKLAW